MTTKIRVEKQKAPPKSNASGAVKKLKMAKTCLRKSLITNGVILGFGAFRQFFHSFSAMGANGLAGSARCADRTPQRGVPTSRKRRIIGETNFPGRS